MLDDIKKIAKIDKSSALSFIKKQPAQLHHQFEIDNTNLTGKLFYNVVFSGMGGSALAAELAHTWSEHEVPFVVSKGYDLPQWVNESTLVIVASYSGNTEETLSSLEQAMKQKAAVAVITNGGKLLEQAKQFNLPVAEIPHCPQPRTAVFYMYRALIEVLVAAKLMQPASLLQMEATIAHLETACEMWDETIPTKQNEAKQIAEIMCGKTPIIYGGPLTYPAAYKWKIDVNENAKNTAWAGQLPEFNHNEFIGWSGLPVEKPFAVIDLISSLERPRVQRRFELSDKLLSGKRPKSTAVEAKGDTILEQMLYLVLLGDFASTYLAILNNTDPTPVDLVEKFKSEL